MRVEHVDADGVVMLAEHVDSADVTTGWDDTLPRPTEQLRLSARLADGGPVRLGGLGAGRWQVSVDGTELGGADLAVQRRRPRRGDVQAAGRGPPTSTPRPGSLVEAVLTILRSEPQPGPDGKLSTLSHVLASGMGTKTLVAAPVPRPLDETLARRGRGRARRRRRRGRRRAHPRAGDRGHRQDHPRPARRAGRAGPRRRGGRRAHRRRRQRGHPGADAVGRRGRRRSSWSGCPARRAVTPWPTPSSASASRPVGWSPPGPPPTGPPPRGPSSRPTCSSTTPTAPSSATAASTPAGPTRPPTGWAPATATARGTTRPPSWPGPASRRARRPSSVTVRNTVGPRLARAGAGLPPAGRGRPAGAPGRLVHGRRRRRGVSAAVEVAHRRPAVASLGHRRRRLGRPWLSGASCSSPAGSATSGPPSRWPSGTRRR